MPDAPAPGARFSSTTTSLPEPDGAAAGAEAAAPQLDREMVSGREPVDARADDDVPGAGRVIHHALVRRGLPALEHRRLPVFADDRRARHPGTELRLGELRMRALELDAVGVVGLE